MQLQKENVSQKPRLPRGRDRQLPVLRLQGGIAHLFLKLLQRDRWRDCGRGQVGELLLAQAALPFLEGRQFIANANDGAASTHAL
eukprot:g10674.t1